MKKFLSFAAIALLACVCVSCGDDDEPGASGETFSKIVIDVEFSNVTANILDNYNITLTGKDFNGTDVNETVNGDFKKTYTCTRVPKMNEEIPANLKLTYEPKTGRPENQQYTTGGMHQKITFTIYDKNGKELRSSVYKNLYNKDQYSPFSKFDQIIQRDYAFDKTFYYGYLKNQMTGKNFYNFWW